MSTQLDRPFVPSLRTATGFALALLTSGAILGGGVRELTGADAVAARDAIEPSAAAAASILFNNAGVALLPLALLALGWDRIPYVAPLADLLVAAILVLNGGAIGEGFAQAGSGLLAYLPHLPAEWTAIALGAGGWAAFRLNAPERRGQALARIAALTVVLLAVAAAIETYAVPLA